MGDTEEYKNLEKFDGTNLRQCMKVWKLYLQIKGLYKYVEGSAINKPVVAANPLADVMTPDPVSEDEQEPAAPPRAQGAGTPPPVETQEARQQRILRNHYRAGRRRDRDLIIQAKAQRPSANDINAVEEWEKEAAKVSVLLYNNTIKPLRGDLENLSTPHEMWQKLQTIYGRQSVQIKRQLKKTLEELRFHQGDNADKFYARMMEIFVESDEAGNHLDNDDKNMYIIDALPSSMKSWADSYLARIPTGQDPATTVRDVKLQLIHDEMNGSGSEDDTKKSYYASSRNNKRRDTRRSDKDKTDKSEIRCYRCNKMGHKAWECRSKPASKKTDSDDEKLIRDAKTRIKQKSVS
ncbi:hypothetical protein BJ508DRAFT_333572 [Ascobolus immersus RN42]|uniref:CCHC-type domain-containing protein n=1 Tax=Ascobolus immersus RN42 TaxID=1160509 RepID=A0A3N4HJ17_ASCIM|nr:hypothetical protein BJ508DRAFT_333572 [Ascobolus immersus RN42]